MKEATWLDVIRAIGTVILYCFRLALIWIQFAALVWWYGPARIEASFVAQGIVPVKTRDSRIYALNTSKVEFKGTKVIMHFNNKEETNAYRS